MAKIRTLIDLNVRTKDNCIIIPKGSFISVSDDMAIYFCNEGLPPDYIRLKKAVRTGFFNLDNLTKTHVDYTFLDSTNG